MRGCNKSQNISCPTQTIPKWSSFTHLAGAQRLPQLSYCHQPKRYPIWLHPSPLTKDCICYLLNRWWARRTKFAIKKNKWSSPSIGRRVTRHQWHWEMLETTLPLPPVYPWQKATGTGKQEPMAFNLPTTFEWHKQLQLPGANNQAHSLSSKHRRVYYCCLHTRLRSTNSQN